MSAKQLVFDESARRKSLRGIELLARAVKVPLAVVDPTKVTRMLQNAVSTAGLLLTIDGMITDLPNALPGTGRHASPAGMDSSSF